MIEIRLPRLADAMPCAELAALVIGEERAGAFIKSHMERHHLIVAESAPDIVGFLAYRTFFNSDKPTTPATQTPAQQLSAADTSSSN